MLRWRRLDHDGDQERPYDGIGHLRHAEDVLGFHYYYTMCYLDDGSERAVINQLLFVEAPPEAAPAKRSLAFYVD